jgi:hypothetical protein
MDTDQKLGVALTNGSHERRHPAGVLSRPDVQDIGTLVHSAVHRGHRDLGGVNGTAIGARVRDPRDDGHHRRPVGGQSPSPEPHRGHRSAGAGSHPAPACGAVSTSVVTTSADQQ